MTPTEFIHDYAKSARAHGLEHTLGLIHDNAVYWFSNGTSHVGKSAIEKAIRRNFEIIKNEDYRITDIVWVAESPDIAVCIYRFSWQGTIRGTAANGSGRGTSVLVRRGESWVVAHEHLSKESSEA